MFRPFIPPDQAQDQKFDARPTEPAASSAEIYGRLKEGAFIAGFSFERACGHLEWLLEEDRWKLDGRYDDVNKFLESIKLDQFRIAVDQRKRLANRIKELQPAASQRAIAKVVGVTNVTVHRDLNAENGGAEKAPITNVTPSPADLSGPAAAQLIDRVVTKDQRSDERRQEQEEKIAQVRARETAPPDGTYDVIVIDPPWPMEKIERDVRPNQSALLDYPTMSEAELRALDIPAAADCHVWLWTTQRFQPMAFRLLECWGLRFVCTFVWHKPGGFQPDRLFPVQRRVCAHPRGLAVVQTAKDFSVCSRAAWSVQREA